MNKFYFIAILTIVALFSGPLYAWDSYDYDTCNFIEIDHNVVIGKDAEIYDYNDDSYHDVQVASVNQTELEVFDYDTGEYRTFEMETVIVNRETKAKQK